MIVTDDQEETDRYWNAIVGNEGMESACGWCTDRWGFSWPTMRKIDIAALEDAATSKP
jgi:predicted 3-demethylubiquinone-9 3-methyltransferase (glyoxalase superfamily)